MPTSGKILHNKKLFHSDQPEPLGNNVNCYASPSPAIEPGRVYVHFGSYGTACLDTANGEVLWQRDDLPCRHYRGPSSSVVLFENLVILTLDGVDLQYVVALDKKTGDTVWKTDRDVEWNDQDVTGKSPEAAKRILDGDMRKAHSTPLIVKLPERRAANAQLRREGGVRVRSAQRQRALANRCRRLQRRRRGPSITTASPTCVTGIIHPELWAIRADAKGNLTETDDVLWRLESRRLAHRRRRSWSTASSTWSATTASSTASMPTTASAFGKSASAAHIAASPIYADGLHLLLRPGRHNDRHQTRPQVRSRSPPTRSTTASWRRPPSTDERSSSAPRRISTASKTRRRLPIETLSVWSKTRRGEERAGCSELAVAR